MPVGLISRTAATVDAARAAVAAAGVTVAGAAADAGQDDQLTAALDALTGQLGVPEALVYNAGLIQHDRPGELSRERYFAAYAINVLGAMTAAVHLAPAMAEAGGGTILITGGMPEPDPAVTSLSLGKAGVRALTKLLASEYGPGRHPRGHGDRGRHRGAGRPVRPGPYRRALLAPAHPAPAGMGVRSGGGR